MQISAQRKAMRWLCNRKYGVRNSDGREWGCWENEELSFSWHARMAWVLEWDEKCENKKGTAIRFQTTEKRLAETRMSICPMNCYLEIDHLLKMQQKHRSIESSRIQRNRTISIVSKWFFFAAVFSSKQKLQRKFIDTGRCVAKMNITTVPTPKYGAVGNFSKYRALSIFFFFW